MTFEPHPRLIVTPQDESFQLITDLDERMTILQNLGVDHIIIMPFTVEFSQMNPYEYVEDLLIEKISVDTLIIGYDHRFGLNRAGDLAMLEAYADKQAFRLIKIPEQEIDSLKISSTNIRNHLSQGQIAAANQLLGHDFQLNGVIIRGARIAGTMGYPTANVRLRSKHKLIPAFGTYAADCILQGRRYRALLYIGISATLKNSQSCTIEVHILHHFEQEFYDAQITVIPLQYIRRDEKFGSKETLLTHITADAREVDLFHAQREVNDLVTVAVLNYNGAELLRGYLPSLRRSSLRYSFKIVVIDNGSTDYSVSVVESLDATISIIALKENRGYAGGYNEGLKNIGSKYLALVNSDIFGDDGWLDPLLDTLENDQYVAAVQPKIKSYNEPEMFEYAGAAGGFLDPLAYPYCRGRLLAKVEKDEGQYDTSVEVDWTSGAAMVVRSQVFSDAGGFDTDFFAHQEEIDLCWRMRRLGYRLKAIPASIVLHLGGGTLDYQHPKKLYLNIRNNYWMVRKNKVGFSLFLTIAIRVMLDFMLSLGHVLKGKMSLAKNILSGIRDGMGDRKAIRQKRTSFEILKKRYQIGSPIESKRKLLAIQYYLLNKKRYQDL